MLGDIHNAIRQLIYEQGRIPAAEVDICFEMPTKEWVDSLVRPTLCLFLFDIRENTDLRRSGMQTTREGNRAVFRLPPRRFDLRYMISALTSIADDQYLLLWRVLGTLLKHPELPAEVLPESLRLFDVPLNATVGKTEDGPRPHDLWGALELPPRPALIYAVTAPLDLEISHETPLSLSSSLRFARRAPEEEAADRGITPAHVVADREELRVGGVVRNRAGMPLVGITIGRTDSPVEVVSDDAGAFVLRNVSPGRLHLLVGQAGAVPRPITIDVPSHSYDIVLE